MIAEPATLPHIVTEAEFDAALRKVIAGTETAEDMNLIRAWWHRVDDERAETVRKICASLDGIGMSRA